MALKFETPSGVKRMESRAQRNEKSTYKAWCNLCHAWIGAYKSKAGKFKAESIHMATVHKNPTLAKLRGHKVPKGQHSIDDGHPLHMRRPF